MKRLNRNYGLCFLAIMLALGLFTPNLANAGIFGYLSEFWNLITGAAEGTVEWFQSLGNAVGGAIGNILLYPLKVIFDAVWCVKIIADIFFNLMELGWSIISSFFSFIGNFIRDFFAKVIIIPGSESDILLDNSIITTLMTIPLMSLLFQIIGYGFLGLLIFSALKHLKHF